ncbi:diadenylate cyclase CdaA [Ruminococcaceae bacterium OttesenSCG-928-D13]|nr:diadenylate cyclase CdaA [Ruminococcaceae bacterium OttesenSCG-928-D13]
MLENIGSFFSDTLSKLSVLFSNVHIQDFIDVLVVAFIVYELIILVRHTRAAQLAKGVVLLLVVYVVALLLEMRVLLWVLNAVMQFGIIVLAVVFQPELRRAIEQVGGVNAAFNHFFRAPRMEDVMRQKWQGAIVAVCDAAERMAEQRVGALIVLERNTNLNEIIRTGTTLRSDVNVEMLGTIFYEGTPLHDGATVVRDARIEAAGCFLPLSNNLAISRDMGTRHRSALGMSENSDAVVVVVSEETGIISVAKNAVLIRRLDRQNLLELLISEIIPPVPEEKPKGLRRFIPKKARASTDEKE